MKEHVELRGFEPLAQRYELYFPEISSVTGSGAASPLLQQDLSPKYDVCLVPGCPYCFSQRRGGHTAQIVIPIAFPGTFTRPRDRHWWVA
jgi:hypothetical protein